jgi:glycosyltransferase involved in cell wall biosynthesis
MVKVSVCMITYNHEPFIAQAIESVLMQRTSFPYELVIGEDCSTDGTREIVRQYAEKHPDIIRPLFREQNLGMHRNFVDTLAHCRGEYVALLEGDDYWTDPYKLQKQAEFLDEHPEYVLVGCNALIIREDEGFRTLHVRDPNRLMSFDFGTRDMILGVFCHTSTVMFRNGLLKGLPEAYYREISADRMLFVLLSQYGKCRYMNDVAGVHRIHRGGASQMLREEYGDYKGTLVLFQNRIRQVTEWNDLVGVGYSEEVRYMQERYARKIVSLALEHLDFHTALIYAQWIDAGNLQTKKTRLVVRVLQQIGKLLRVERAG